MKKILIFAAAMLIGIVSNAQESNDTINTKELQEVTIEAPKVIRKADMDVYHPSKSAVDNSKNGMQLLTNLMIPTLSVNDALGTVQVAGQSVQIRINGRISTIDQVRALLPQTIKRVEWMENPGLRYGGANYVVNFIVTNPSLGGSLMTNVRPALNQAWGFYMADLKLNSGRSQWEVGSNFKLTNKLKTHREYSETFTFLNGNSLTRDETSRGGNLTNTMANAWLSYNYIKPDTTVFMAEFSYYGNLRDKWTYDGLLTLSDGSDDIYLTDTNGAKGNHPSLSLYWQQNFRNKQMLVVDFKSTFYFGRSFSEYLEQRPGAPAYLNDIRTNIKDRNQAYALETDYIKNWKSSRFTAGVSYTANRNRSEYENLGGQIFHQRQDRVYFFAEYFRRFGKWSASAGMGAQYTDFKFRESDQGEKSGARDRRRQSPTLSTKTIIYVLNSPPGSQRHRFPKPMSCRNSSTASNGASVIRT